MKNMKKLLQKAMVFTLAAAMLVGTPLTASAAGFFDLFDLYRIEDGAENAANNTNTSTKTNTNTDTNTNTNTGTLPGDVKVLGIKLDQANVSVMKGRTRRLTATLDWGGAVLSEEDKALETELLDSLTWTSSDEKVISFRKLSARPGQAQRTIVVTGRSYGNAVITVSLDNETHNIHYTAEAKATVFQYADKLEFDNEKIDGDAYTGNSLVLDEYVNRYIKDGDNFVQVNETGDNLTYTLIDDGNKAATLKNGVLTLKKVTTSDKPVKLMASGKNVKSENVGIVNIKAGTNATKLEFTVEGVGTIKGTNLTWLANDGLTTAVKAKVTGKKSTDRDKKTAPCTDKITWSSANSDIVTVETVTGGDKAAGEVAEKTVYADEAVNFKNDECTINLSTRKAGKTQLIGKVSSGKTFKLNVTVSADLTSVVLGEADTLYTGQIIDLNDKVVLQRYGSNGVDSTNFEAEGLVKWEFTDKRATDNKYAKLTAKTGALEIKPDLKKTGAEDTRTITVKAVAAKTGRNVKPFAPVVDKENEISFDLKQVNISSITVTKEDGESPFVSIASGGRQTPSKATDSIDVGNTKGYVLNAIGSIEGGEPTDVTMALGWTASGNGKTIKAKKEGNVGYLTAVKKGSSTITASGVTAKGRGYAAIKVTFKDTVNAPSEHITLSLKNRDVAAKFDRDGKTTKQTITIKPVLDKGTTTKNKAPSDRVLDGIKWEASQTKLADGTVVDLNSKIKDGKLTLEAGSYAVGDQITVNATVVNTEASDTITITIVNPTQKVVFKQYKEDGTLGDDIGSKGIEIEESVNVCAYINAAKGGEAGTADGSVRAQVASYTVSGKGVVFVNVGSNGKISIEPIKQGTVTIKFVMTDGKSASLKVNVKKDSAWINPILEMTSFISDMFE